MDIAIIGMAGIFPEADSTEKFYSNLCAGRDSIRPLSRERILATTIAEEDYLALGWIDQIDKFDPDFFRISLGESQTMDPHQRLLLQVAYHTFENSGYHVDHFRGSRTQVIVGDTALNYFEHAERFDTTLLTGNMNATVAGRIARFFDLRGAALMIDTTCSSALAAVHYGCQALHTGEADFVLACGVKLMLFPYKKGTGSIGIASPDGKVRSFCKEANGTGGGELVASVLLKPYQKALADNDIIHAVIKGSAVNQDAALSGSLTSPSARAQADAIKEAWRRAGVPADSITYVEAHGTATKLGDPIEIEGLNLAFRESTAGRDFCAVSSVKSNIGHTDSAAGMAGLIKAVLAVKYKKLFPVVNFSAVNPLIDLTNSSVYINTALADWNPGQVRRAGISSFGLSGTNCHVIIEESRVDDAPETSSGGPYLLVVSGNTPGALVNNVKAIRAMLTERPGLNIGAVSDTLLWGRKHYGYRFAATVASVQDAVRALSADDTGENRGGVAKLLLTFSDSALPEDFRVDAALARIPAFRSAYESCLRYVPAAQASNIHCQTLAVQLAYYRMIEGFGVDCTSMISFGLGEITVAVITGEMSLQQGVQRALRYSAEKNNEHSAGKIGQFARAQAPGTVLVETSPHSFIAKVIHSAAPGLKVIPYAQPEPLELIKTLFLAGAPFAWNKHVPSRFRKAELPGYEFEKKRCWIKEPKWAADWFYALEWIPTGKNTNQPRKYANIVLFAHGGEIGKSMADQITGQGYVPALVVHGDAFSMPEKNTYCFNWAVYDHYLQFFKAIQFGSNEPVLIIHCGACAEARADKLEAALTFGLYAQFYLAKAIHESGVKQRTDLYFLTHGARKVLPDDVVINPVHASAHGLSLCIESEMPLVRVRCWDVDKQSTQSLFNEICSDGGSDGRLISAAFRNGVKYGPSISPAGAPTRKIQFTEGGTYLITGGASGIGKELAVHLSKKYNIKLALLGRKKYADLDAETRSFIEGSHARGSTICYEPAELADKQELQLTLTRIENTLGPVQGVIHCAGTPGEKLIAKHSLDSFRKPLDSKVFGTVNLVELLAGQLQFILFFSSSNSIIGAPMNSNYSAANIFLDAYAHALEQGGMVARSINWPGWKEVGMLARMASRLRVTLDDTSLTTAEGVQCFDQLLNIHSANIIVSKQNPDGIVADSFLISRNTAGRPTQPREIPVPTGADAGLLTDDQIRTSIRNSWISVLKPDELDDDTDFFDSGGHSLNGIQLINQVKSLFGITMEIDDLFEFGTVRQLCAFVKSKLATTAKTGGAAAQRIQPVELQEHYGLSQQQQGFWPMRFFNDGASAYNLNGIFEIEGAFDPMRMETAYRRLIQRHEIMRTAFILVDDNPRQKVYAHDDHRFGVEFVQLPADPFSNEQINSIVSNTLARKFGLYDCALHRFTVVSFGASRHFLIFAIDHINADGWSIEVILRDFMALYDNPESGLPSLQVQYKDFAAWSTANFRQSSGEDRSYWLKKLDDGRVTLSLPPDKPKAKVRTYQGDLVQLELSPAAVSAMIQFSVDRGGTLFVFLLTSLKVLISRKAGEGMISIGGSLAGRSDQQLEDQVGLFVNTVVFRDELLHSQSFETVFNQVRETYLGAQAHSHYPFHLIVNELVKDRNLAQSPLFDIEINLFTDIGKKASASSQPVLFKAYRSPLTYALFDVSFDFRLFADHTLQLTCRYSVDLFAKSTMEDLLTRFRLLTERCIHDPQQPVGTVDLKSASEMEAEKSIHEKFGLQEFF